MEEKDIKITENKMGIMPVNRLLINMSVPMMFSMLVQALYNVVDSIFVAMVSEDALTAVSMAFPIQALLISLGAGTGVGINALVSRALGAKNNEQAGKVAGNGIFLALCSYVVFLIVGITVVTPFYRGQTDNAQIITYGEEYLTIVCCVSIGMLMQFTFERLLQSTGKTVLSMYAQIVGAVTNLILDPILIFGLLDMPRMGVKGAAIATVIGQMAAGIFAMILNAKYNPEIKITIKGFKPSLSIIKNIYAIGIPSIIMQSIGSVMIYGLNKILMGFSSTAVAVFGVYFKLQSFVFLPIFGLNNGIIPIVAYNYGAKNRKRIIDTYKYAVVFALFIMAVGMMIFEFVPEKLFMMFNASDNMLSIGSVALRRIAVHFPVAAYCIVTGSLFQALGKAVYSMINSIMRQLVVLLPAAYLLSMSGDISNVWWAFPIAEIMSAVVTTIFLSKINSEILQKIPIDIKSLD